VPSESLPDLLHRLLEQLLRLFRQEVRLASAELSQTAGRLGARLTTLICGGAVLFAGVLLLLLAAAQALALFVPQWLATCVEYPIVPTAAGA
jgi:hypothetical protein